MPPLSSPLPSTLFCLVTASSGVCSPPPSSTLFYLVPTVPYHLTRFEPSDHPGVLWMPSFGKRIMKNFATLFWLKGLLLHSGKSQKKSFYKAVRLMACHHCGQTLLDISYQDFSSEGVSSWLIHFLIWPMISPIHTHFLETHMYIIAHR